MDLSARLPGEWDRVCGLAPYASNRQAREILGLPVNIEFNSPTAALESIAFLVTLRRERLVGLVEVPRGGVDFAHVGGECFSRAKSAFEVPQPGYPLATHEEQILVADARSNRFEEHPGPETAREHLRQ